MLERDAARGVRVLVVDDEAEIRAALRMVLEEAGHAVEEAQNGREALASLRASPEAVVVLLDYMMPVMDGGEVLRVVSADGDGRLRRHAFIVLTAARQVAALQEHLLSLGGWIVPKPFDIDQLVGHVAHAATQLGTTAS